MFVAFLNFFDAQRLKCDELWCSDECNVYLQKFATANNADGSGASKIAFSGNTSDVEVKLRYSDADLFNDATYFGLVQEDAKTPETTCLDLKLYKFLGSDFQNGTYVRDLSIQPSSNTQKLWRYYSFTLKGTDLASRLVQTSNSNNYVYQGYYDLAFYAAGTDQVQYTFYFHFTVIVDKLTVDTVDKAFKLLSLTASAGWTPVRSCTITSETKLNWCQDFNCTKYIEKRDLHLNDQFVLQQVITTQGMTNFIQLIQRYGILAKDCKRKLQLNKQITHLLVLLKLYQMWKWEKCHNLSEFCSSNNVNGTR